MAKQKEKSTTHPGLNEHKRQIIEAGRKAVDELIKVAKESIVDSDDDITADRLKNAAATKKLAIFDAFEILDRIQTEEEIIRMSENGSSSSFGGFPGQRAKGR